MPEIQVVEVNKTNQDFVSYEVVSLKTWLGHAISDTSGTISERLLTHGFLMDTMRKLMGRTLTIIDASTTGQQNKAMKDLVRGTFSDEMGFAAEWAFEQRSLFKNLPDHVDEKALSTVTVEEALGVK